MANVAITNDAWTLLSVTSGSVQNISATAKIEINSAQTDNSGIVLEPGEWYSWDSKSIYARAVTEPNADIRVVNFKKSAGGGGGTAATITIGTVTTGAAGSSASVTNVGTSQDAIFDFTIPQGAAGASGTAFTLSGLYPTYADMVAAHPSPQPSEAHLVGTVDDNTVYLWDTDVTPAAWTNIGPIRGLKGDTGAQGATGPAGADGAPGTPGDAATIQVGTVTGGASASVTNSGTTSAAVFDFVIPKGDKGDTGDTGATGADGAAATNQVGTVTAGVGPSVTNSGTTSAAVFDFVVPYQNVGIVDPVMYSRMALMESAQTDLTIYGTVLQINGNGYAYPETTIDIDTAANWDDSTYATAANRAGRDFYVYMCQPNPVDNIVPVMVLSANSTVPTGYTADNSRKIGGFHCLCLSVGAIPGHTLSGYMTGDILPQSIWDLKWRAMGDNVGVVWVPGVNKWVDIYLASYNGTQLVSEFGGVIADGTSSPAFSGEKLVEYFGLVTKQLPARDDFVVFAKGSNEGTAISGSADPNTTGGHVDTGGRRMISNYGIEDCCGALWQWTSDCPEAQSTSYTSGNYWIDPYTWNTNPVYNSTGDSQYYGECHGLLRRLGVGGAWHEASHCGSRSVLCNTFGAIYSNVWGVHGCDAMRSNM